MKGLCIAMLVALVFLSGCPSRSTTDTYSSPERAYNFTEKECRSNDGMFVTGYTSTGLCGRVESRDFQECSFHYQDGSLREIWKMWIDEPYLRYINCSTREAYRIEGVEEVS